MTAFSEWCVVAPRGVVRYQRSADLSAGAAPCRRAFWRGGGRATRHNGAAAGWLFVLAMNAFPNSSTFG